MGKRIEELEYRITAKDEASAVVGGVRRNIRDLSDASIESLLAEANGGGRRGSMPARGVDQDLMDFRAFVAKEREEKRQKYHQDTEDFRQFIAQEREQKKAASAQAESDSDAQPAGGLAGKLADLRKQARSSGQIAAERAISSPTRLLELLSGSAGLTVAAVAILGNALSDLSRKFLEVQNRVQEGRGAMSEYKMALLESIPVLGSFATFTKNAYEFHQNKKDPLPTKAMREYFQAMREEMKKTREEFKQLDEESVGTSNELDFSHMSPADRVEAEARLKWDRQTSKGLTMLEKATTPSQESIAQAFLNTADDKLRDEMSRAASMRFNIQKEELDTEKSHQFEIEKINEEGRIRRLRSLGLEGEARLAEIKLQYKEEQQAAIDKAKQIPRFTFEDSRRLGEDLSAAANNRDAELQVARAQDARDRLTTEQEISRVHLDYLRGQAEYGNPAIAREVKRLEIQDAYKNKELEITKLLEKQNLTWDQRKQLIATVAGLQQQEKVALKLASFGDTYSGGTFSSADGGRTTGLAASARDRDPNAQLIAEIRKNNNVVSELNGNMKDLIKKLPAGTATQIIFGIGTSAMGL